MKRPYLRFFRVSSHADLFREHMCLRDSIVYLIIHLFLCVLHSNLSQSFSIQT